MAKALKANYQKNINILRENMRRGMTAGQAMSVINSWRDAFKRANLYGEDEVAFINGALEVVSGYTHMSVVEVA